MTAQKATGAQIRSIYGLLEKTGSTKGKADLVYSFSNERTENISELLFVEADQLIKHLTGQISHRDTSAAAKSNDMRRKIIAMAHKLNWKKPDGKINMESIDEWSKKYGKGKKALNDYTYEELPTIVSQFEAMYFSKIKKK